MDTIEYIWNNLTIRIILLSVIGILVLTFLILLSIHISKVKQGKYSKFFWIESGQTVEKNDLTKETKITGKNINTGTNHGKIGDN